MNFDSTEKRHTYAATLSAAMGAVLQKLKEAGLEEDALIFFISDKIT